MLLQKVRYRMSIFDFFLELLIHFIGVKSSEPRAGTLILNVFILFIVFNGLINVIFIHITCYQC
jgi:hypothetical protein